MFPRFAISGIVQLCRYKVHVLVPNVPGTSTRDDDLHRPTWYENATMVHAMRLSKPLRSAVTVLSRQRGFPEQVSLFNSRFGTVIEVFSLCPTAQLSGCVVNDNASFLRDCLNGILSMLRCQVSLPSQTCYQTWSLSVSDPYMYCYH